MQPLAYRVRPTGFDDIIGQDHLVGKNGIIRKMIDENKLLSFILFGDPGCGKTSIAMIIKDLFPMESYLFNASVDNKAKLKEISDATAYYEHVIVIIDEIHRMKKDTQDFLLPYVESGKIIIIGLTTENPYQSINPAVRSRCHIYRMNKINNDEISLLLKKVIIKEQLFKTNPISDDILNYVIQTSGSEIRTALNMIEALSLTNEPLTMTNAEAIIGIKNLPLDSKGNNYFDILSAFQKSIRGSDVDAALHYLARLIRLEDLTIITRRLMVIAYEDIGLANPYVGPRCMAACQAAINVGLPEARIPLSYIAIELALSPKSNTAESSIDKALADLDNSSSYDIPPHILNREIKYSNANYKYPHDYPDDFVVQQYLPTSLLDKVYYEGKETGKYERALKERYKAIKQLLNNVKE